MQQWRDEAIILTGTKHGEESSVLHLLTRFNGRTAGYLRSGKSPRVAPYVQSGNVVVAAWQSRLPDQLGYLTVEPLESLAMPLMQRAELSLALQAVTHLLLYALPERQALPAIFEGTRALLRTLPEQREDWAQSYIWWEVHLLRALGFGLRLDRCVQTEDTSHLTHVSPRSGHAVSRALALPYADRLLRLPEFLGGAENLGAHEIAVGLALTGYFLQHHVATALGKPLPEARTRLQNHLLRPVTHHNNLEDKKRSHG